MEKRALVLSGAGAKIGLHIGAAKYLIEDLGLEFDVYAGTSAGALVAAALAMGLSVKEIENIFFNVDLFKLIMEGRRVWGAISLMFNGYWSEGNKYRKFLEDMFKDTKFEDLEKELYIIAYNLDKDDLAIFSNKTRPKMPLWCAVYCSSCLPFVLKPLIISGHRYVDGGIGKNFPVDLPELPDKIYCSFVSNHKLSRGLGGFKRLFSYAKELLDALLSANSIVSYRDALGLGRDIRIVQSYYPLSMFDFSVSKRDKESMIDIGYSSAKESLSEYA